MCVCVTKEPTHTAQKDVRCLPLHDPIFLGHSLTKLRTCSFWLCQQPVSLMDEITGHHDNGSWGFELTHQLLYLLDQLSASVAWFYSRLSKTFTPAILILLTIDNDIILIWQLIITCLFLINEKNRQFNNCLDNIKIYKYIKSRF